MKCHNRLQIHSICIGVSIVIILIVLKQLENTSIFIYLEQDFEKWMMLQNEIQSNVAKVCEKYKDTLQRVEIPTSQLMYDKRSGLLFCRNAKVRIDRSNNFYRGK